MGSGESSGAVAGGHQEVARLFVCLSVGAARSGCQSREASFDSLGLGHVDRGRHDCCVRKDGVFAGIMIVTASPGLMIKDV